MEKHEGSCRDKDVHGVFNPSVEWSRERKNSLQNYTDESENQNIHTALCTLLKKRDAGITCQAHKDAVFEASRREDALVSCMGTVGEKSLIFQIFAHMKKDRGLLTIVVVPFVALIEDHIRRCGDLQILVARCEERDSFDYQILLVPVEQVGTDEFQKVSNNN